MKKYQNALFAIALLFLLTGLQTKVFSQPCDPSTPSFTVDLSSAPDSVWTSPFVTRNGNCCGNSVCVEFVITTHPNTVGLTFAIAAGAPPSGALLYQIGCGTATALGSSVTLSGTGPHLLRFCKAGGAPNSYSITVFSNNPGANAGPDQTACANNPNVMLNGSVTNATGGIWSGGSGTFSPNDTTLNAVYTPSPAEIAAGSVTLTLTTTGNGGNPPASDDMIIFYTPSPTVNAGSDQFVCANNPNVNLSGSVTNASGGNWISAFGGSFVPNNSTLNATYIPSSAEIANGLGILFLTSTGNGSCNPDFDTMFIIFDPAPSVNAGPDQTLCLNSPNAQLSGNVTLAPFTMWTTSGTGIFVPNNSDLNATYVASDADTSAGLVTITLTGSRPSCVDVSDDLVLNYQPCTGIDELSETDFVIYPNPAEDYFYISGNWSSNAVFTIIDYQGKEFTQDISSDKNELRINSSDFKPGLYILRIEDGDAQMTKKLYIQ